MASSRIYVNGLPGNITESEFKKHFSSLGPITDTKLIPRRKIGFVGYGTPDEASKAVKYFNKTFIRMSRIHVELATPISESKTVKGHGLGASGANSEMIAERPAVRKRYGEDAAGGKAGSDNASGPPESKKRKRSDAAQGVDAAGTADQMKEITAKALPEQQSDDEYEAIPKKVKRVEQAPETLRHKLTEEHQHVERASAQSEPDQIAVDPPTSEQAAVTDADWARSRTSRLLGLLDEDEEENAPRNEGEEKDSEPAKSVMEKGICVCERERRCRRLTRRCAVLLARGE